MTERNYSFELKGLSENIEKLADEAQTGKFDAAQRLDAIKKLANPIFDFSASDYKRILDKKLPRPVEKGIELYKMMSQLAYLVQPVGKRKGTACAVRRIDYESLIWEEFLELRGSFSAGFIMEALKLRTKPNFNGLDILSERQKELYQKIKVYFGNKKKPTLQSLAMNLLSEETDGKDYSERSLYSYLDAVDQYQKKRKKASGFDFLYFTFHSVTSFNKEEKTVRESLESMSKTIIDVGDNLRKMLPQISLNIFKDILPKPNMNFIAEIYKDLIPQFPTVQMSQVIGSMLSNLYSSEQIPENDEPKQLPENDEPT
jgi:hypothetical protein